jgi:hypothetical protein
VSWVATGRPWASKNRPLPLRDNNNDRVRENMFRTGYTDVCQFTLDRSSSA